jgi:hypothetical protein
MGDGGNIRDMRYDWDGVSPINSRL